MAHMYPRQGQRARKRVSKLGIGRNARRNDGIVLKRKDPIVTDEFMSIIQKVADKNDAALKALVER